MHDLSASIVVYKSNQRMLRQTIESFLEATEHSILYIIDNSPTDEVSELVCHPRIKYYFNGSNLGFGPGHNVALREVLKTEAKYHLVLNPDIYFDAHVISELHAFMEGTPDAGLCMPKVLYPDGRLQPLCKLLPSPSVLFMRRFLFFMHKLTARYNHLYELQFSGYNRIMDVPFLSGCFMFLRTDALRKVGLFDERIFLYTEDVDLSRRIHKHFRTVFYPHATIYHYHQRGSYKNTRLLLHNVNSAIKYFNKWGWFDEERRIINQNALVKIYNELG